MQSRNWVWFFLSFIVIIVGFPWVRNHFWPPAWHPAREVQLAGEQTARMLTSVTGTGVGDALQIAIQAAVTESGADEFKTAVAKDRSEKRKLAVKPPEPAKKEEPAKPPITIALGNENFDLNVTLTNRGAGVRDLTLTKFKAADWYGRPAKDSEGNSLPLQLIPPSNYTSFALYHYATAEDSQKSPLDTLGKRAWQIIEQKTDGDEQRVVFATELPEFGIRIVKTFTLGPKDYHLGLSVKLERLPDAKDPKPFRYQLAGGHGLPIEGVWYTTTFRNAFFDWVDAGGADIRNQFDNRTIAQTNGSDRIARNLTRFKYAAVAIQYFASAIAADPGDPDHPAPNFIEFVRATNEATDTAAELLKLLMDPGTTPAEREHLLRSSVPGINPELLKLLTDPEKENVWQTLQEPRLPDIEKIKAVREVVPNIGPEALKTLLDPGPTEAERKTQFLADQIRPFLIDITVRTISEAVELKPGESVEHKYVLYHGPVKVGLLEKLGGEGGISPKLAEWYKDTLHLKTLTDYGRFSYWSDFIIFFTNAVHWLISVLRHISPNDAICIILVTVMVRLAMMPVSRRQAASMAKQQEAMAKVQPEIKKLTERFKNDLVGKQQAQMELYRKHGINPAASLGGCLMLFLQMPVFLGLYFALQESFFFRLESFLWIKNLTAPDMLIGWSEKIPYISDPEKLGSFFYLGPYFNLLPILALSLMFVQMRWMQPPPTDEQMAQQQKMMQYIMIPMFAFMFYKMPAGLCLYFISTTLWGLAERKFLPKKKAASPVPAASNGRAGTRGKGRGELAPPPGKLRAWWDKVLKEASKK